MHGSDSTLVHLLRSKACGQPSKRAYTFLLDGEEEGTSLSYFELDRQARAIGAFLQSSKVKGERALLLYQQGLEFVAAFYGCLYAGIVPVPTPPVFHQKRANQTLSRLQIIANDSQPIAILTTSAILSKAKPSFAHVPTLETILWVATDLIPGEIAETWRDPDVSADDLALLQYTSGSTASPKGVMVSHRNLLYNSAYINEGFQHTPESISLTWLPHFHDMGLIDGIIQPLYMGFPSYLMPATAFLQNPFRWLSAISRYRVTHSGGPNFAYDLCVRKINAEKRALLDLSSWSVAYDGAEPVRNRTLEQFAAAFAPCGFRSSAFYPAYGLAEATLKVSGGRRNSGPAFCSVVSGALEKSKIVEAADPGSEARTLVSSGRVTFDSRVVIVNPETLTRCALDEVGEIWISGPGVAQGYWMRPKETRETFQAHLADTGEGPFLRTGDLGFIKDGELFVTGRLKDLIIIRGLNHYPQDIELSAEQSHTALRLGGGAAFSIDVDGEERLIVVNEVDPRQSPDFDGVIAYIRKAVSEDHDVQVYAVALVEFGGIPKTSSGKLQRRACRTMFLEGSLNVLAQWQRPSVSDSELSAPVPTAQNLEEITEWLRMQFAAKIGLIASGVDIDQPITRYGLDSLIAVELTHSIEASLGIALSMTSFLEGPSISDVAVRVMSHLAMKTASQDAPIGENRGAQEVEESPLSFGQQSLWFLHQIARESAAYNISFPVLIKTAVDLSALQRAFQSLVDRHASLRTTFRVAQGEPFQRIHKHVEVSFEVEDASLWSEELLNEHLMGEAYRPFDLESGPLFRVKAFSRSAREHVLLVAVHHIVSDLWSLAVILPELGILYSAEKRNVAASLPPSTFQYTDYVRSESQMLASEEGERLLAYWRKQLDGASPVTRLPTDHLRPRVQTYRGAAKAFAFDPQQTRELKELSRECGVTLFMTLLAAFQVLIHRYTGQQDVLVGAPTAGRDRADVAGLIGYLVNPVVLRADFSEAPTFRSFLGQVRQTVIEALDHSRYPFPLLVKRLQLERDPSRSPLFQVFFVLQKSQLLNDTGITSLALGEAGVRIQIGELDLESISLEQRAAQFDLSLVMTEITGELRGSLEYNTDLFDGSTIDRMVGHFQALVKEIIADPDKRVSSLQVLTKAEQETILVNWNETAVNYGEFQSLHQLFESQVERDPNATALIYEDQSLTYSELNQKANQLAHRLRSVRVGPDVCVGVLMERSIELVIGLLGILKAGGAYLPLDPQYPQERLSFMVDDAGVKIMLTQKRFEEKITRQDLHTFCLDDDWNAVVTENTQNPSAKACGDNLAYVIYTSGSTGKPKGAMNTHRGIINRLCWMQAAYGLTDADRVLQKTPFTFDVSVWEFFWPLITGTRLVLARPGGHQDSAYLIRLISEEKITTLHFVPSMLEVFLEDPRLAECNSIRRVICSGEALSAELQDRFFARLDAELHNLYGPTEAAVDVTFWACERESTHPIVPIGRPIANTQIYILDKEMRPVPVGLTGEVFIAGVGLARGYLNRPDMTAEKFVPDPFANEPGERMYETGDLARFLPGGAIEFLGRADYQVKIRGFRIELGEIERALAAHPAVREVVVVARETRANDKSIVAYLSPTQDNLPTLIFPSEESEEAKSLVAPQNSDLSSNNLRKYLQAKLPEYMVPSAFMLLEKLPLSTNGKIDRRALPWPEYTRNGLKQEYVGPRTENEEAIVNIFSELLALEKIGVDDNFFELGGHSLLATQVLTRILEQFKVEVSLRRLFETPTVAGLAEAVAQLRSEATVEIQPIAKISQPVEERLLAQLDQLSDRQVEALLKDFTIPERSKKWTADPNQ
jgi:amino acid adenylation domain-containing protein